MRFRIFAFCFFLSSLAMAQDSSFTIYCHRGCRGLMPENTIPAFLKAIELNVLHLELDVVVTADSQVVVSHEPWINNKTCLMPDSTPLPNFKRAAYSIYKMPYEQVKSYDCGSKFYAKFPGQHKLVVGKPLLSEVISTVDTFCCNTKGVLPYYSIELKSKKNWIGTFQPETKQFVDLVMKIVQQYSEKERYVLQSFDPEVLRILHQDYPEYTLAALNETNRDVDAFFNELGFVTTIYSPWYVLATAKTLEYCKQHNIKIIPWTVNNDKVFLKLKYSGVNGIITDYPDRYR